MTAQLDLFCAPKAALRYPDSPGVARGSDTSLEAAPSHEEASALRQAVMLTFLNRGPMTADEVAATLGRSILAVRPRVTELKSKGSIYDTGLRRRNAATGKSAAVMAAR